MLLKHGNSKYLFDEIAKQSVDLILTDPPYDMITDNIKTTQLRKGEKKLFSFFFNKVLKRTGNLVMFIGLRDRYVWHETLTSEHFTIKSELVMTYNGGYKVKKHFLPAHECVVHYVASKDYYFEGGELFLTVYETLRPRGILRNWGYDYKTAPEEKATVTPKPLGLVQKLVEILCPEGGTVLDPFMGSGTTGEACVLTKRDFIGFEIDYQLFKFATKRIKDADLTAKGRGEWW